ncbi:neprilysin-2-like [Stegodyphus dumicola]|uniref:neprilysin-2-like n=1 Tax=Stegodyphus dumicola TaxID=202533 RepID=UPI0015A91AB5|nr:neprilysin-2-like [Stegodyphus dumicola]
MDHVTQIIAKYKANAITPYVGYPNELLDDVIMSKLYVGLNLTNEGYFDKALKVRKWSTDNYFSKYREKNAEKDWKTHANAISTEYSYNNKDNSIAFPAGILQPIFFYKNGPKNLNFGALGSLIGHEITHGFDNKGRKYFVNGKRFDWWSFFARNTFEAKTECIIDQYNTYLNYKDPKNNVDIMVDGNKTHVENLADSAGLKLAYRAYQTWVKHHGGDLKLPGLKYNQNQLFWISAGRALCGEANLDYIMKGGSNGQYFLPEARLNGQISNLEEFSKDFNCAPNQFMNRNDKCQIW